MKVEFNEHFYTVKLNNLFILTEKGMFSEIIILIGLL